MKSAYELAMERLEKESGPTKRLSDAQKEEIAEIERKFEARIAEERLSGEARIAGASSAEELGKLTAELAERVSAIEEQREKAKEAVWEQE